MIKTAADLRIGDIVLAVAGNPVAVGPVVVRKITDAHRSGVAVAKRLYTSHHQHMALAPRDVRPSVEVEVLDFRWIRSHAQPPPEREDHWMDSIERGLVVRSPSCDHTEMQLREFAAKEAGK